MSMFGLGKCGDLMTINLDGDISNELAMLRGIDYGRRHCGRRHPELMEACKEYARQQDEIAKLAEEYLANDAVMTRETYEMMSMCIVKVIFNDPATIVLWGDGSKTIVKAVNEPFDPEKGLAMAIAKKHFGNNGRYYEVFKRWLPKEE